MKNKIHVFNYRIGDTNQPDWLLDRIDCGDVIISDTGACITVGHKSYRLEIGDYIISDAQGDLYSCEGSLFHEAFA